jgi:hypothetical protein
MTIDSPALRKKADGIVDKLLLSLPSRFLLPHQLSQIEICALAMAAGCDMKVNAVADSIQISCRHPVKIEKEGEFFIVYERPAGEVAKRRGRIRGASLRETAGDARLQ